jgi:hypothetical protein
MVLPVFRTISFAGSLSKKNCREVGNRTRTFDHWFAQLQLKVANPLYHRKIASQQATITGHKENRHAD